MKAPPVTKDGTMITDTETESAEYIDDRTLAARTSISRVTWQTWRTRGGGPPYRKVGRRCLYRWAEVAAWLESKRVDPRDAAKVA